MLPKHTAKAHHELHLAWKISQMTLFHLRITQQHHTACMELECVIEKRIYSSSTRRFPLQPWDFGWSIVITCNTQAHTSFWVGVFNLCWGSKTCPGAGGSSDRDSRDKSWGWAPAMCRSQHLWGTHVCWRHRQQTQQSSCKGSLQLNKSTRALWFPWGSWSTAWRSSRAAAAPCSVSASLLQPQPDSAWISLQDQSSRKSLLKDNRNWKRLQLRLIPPKSQSKQKHSSLWFICRDHSSYS